ncbi:MAG: NAD(P)-dependent alcohol dehydrogenase [Elusimicrobiota bacterium]
MKAAVIDGYGPPDVLRIAQAARPSIRDDQVLIEVHASSVNPIDWRIRNGSLRMLMGSRFPKILGFDVSGRVVEAGQAVKELREGDRVYAKSDAMTGQAYAEYAAVSEKAAAIKPAGLSHEQAAAMPLAALTSLQALRERGGIKPGDRVAVIGASGGVGSYAVQIAKAYGAEVTAVCSAGNIDLARELGADRVVDYIEEDVLAARGAYEIVFDAVAARGFSEARRALSERGVYISTVPSAGLAFSIAWSRLTPGRKASFIMLKASGEDLKELARLAEKGKLKSVIDSVYPLEDIQEAHRKSESRRARGKIVIRIR